MKYAVIGAGATGAAVGMFPAIAGEEVWFVDPFEAHMKAIAEHGLNVRMGSYEDTENTKDFNIRINATTEPEEAGKADFIIFMPKGPFTRAAMSSVVKLSKEDTVILTLQNGLGNTDVMKEYIDPKKIAYGLTTISSGVPVPGMITPMFPKSHHIWVGSDNPGLRDVLEEVCRVFRSAGCDANYDEDIKVRVWEKFALNCSGNATTALIRLNARQAASFQPYVDVRQEIIREIDAVAKAQGIRMNPEVIYGLGETAFPLETSPLPDTYTSLAQDVMHRRATEIENLNGAAVKEAAKVGMRVPFNECIYKLMVTLQNSYGMQF
jgi:2-dehydropantoate 2-reductase